MLEEYRKPPLVSHTPPSSLLMAVSGLVIHKWPCKYIEDNRNVSLPCIKLVMTLNVECFSSLVLAMATFLSTIFLFDMYALIISIVARLAFLL